MSSLMQAYTNLAVKYGKVDPSDRKAVLHFFEVTLPSYSPKKQQTIVDQLFQESVGTTGHIPIKSAKQTGIILTQSRRQESAPNRALGVRLTSRLSLATALLRRKKKRVLAINVPTSSKRVAARTR